MLAAGVVEAMSKSGAIECKMECAALFFLTILHAKPTLDKHLLPHQLCRDIPELVHLLQRQ